MAHLPGAGASTAHHDSWSGFVVRALIAGALLVIGIHRAIGAIRHKPIADVSEPERTSSRLRTRLTDRFPTAMRQLAPGAHLSAHRAVSRTATSGS
jgi:hypothetical protein